MKFAVTIREMARNHRKNYEFAFCSAILMEKSCNNSNLHEVLCTQRRTNRCQIPSNLSLDYDISDEKKLEFPDNILHRLQEGHKSDR
jgi:hypothetical protein